MVKLEPHPSDPIVLYGMNERGAILLTEWPSPVSRLQLRLLAEERLKSFSRVEVFQGTRRMLFLERPDR